MGKMICGGCVGHIEPETARLTLDFNNFDANDRLLYTNKSKSNINNLLKSTEIIQKNWKYFNIKSYMRKKLEILLDNEITKIGKFLSEEEFVNKIHQTVLLIENSIKFSPIPRKPLKKLCLNKSPVMLLKGRCYKGEWSLNVKRHGYGIFINLDGSKYEGNWKNNLFNGIGKLIYINGDYYQGEWTNGKANGKGSFVRLDGFTYNGDWSEDLQSGFGEEIYTDGTSYIGQFSKGKKCGKGKLTFINHTFYEGDFLDNSFNGKGYIKWNDGNSYEGEWKLNKMHGKGTFIWSDDRKYIGEYKNDKKDGFGLYYWNPTKFYEGFWLDGKREGPAKVFKKIGKFKYYLFKNGNFEKEIEKNDYERMKQVNEIQIMDNESYNDGNLIKIYIETPETL